MHSALGVVAKSPAEEVSVRINEDAADSQVNNGERKTVTALFADIKGSMDLMLGSQDFCRACLSPNMTKFQTVGKEPTLHRDCIHFPRLRYIRRLRRE